mgnify:CR=1 FL=1
MNPNATSKANILKTSREIIQQNGWAGVSIRSVAAACGVSVGCIYNYFASKTELLSATVESIWSDIFHHPEDEVVFQDTLSCVRWMYQQLEAASGIRAFLPTMRWALSGRILPTANSRCSVHGGTFWKPCVWCCRMIPRSGPTHSQRSLPLKSLRKYSSL